MMDCQQYGGYDPHSMYKNNWNYLYRQGGDSSKQNQSVGKFKLKWKVIIYVGLILSALSLAFVIYDIFVSDRASYPSQITTSRDTEAITTSTPEITTGTPKPERARKKRMLKASSLYLAYGDIAGDQVYDGDADHTVTYGINIPNQVDDKLLPNPGKIKVHILNTEIYPTDDRLIVVSSAAFEKPDPSKGQYFYHRQVNSTRDKDYLSCLLGGVSIAEAYVFTWVNFAVEDFPGVDVTNQCILMYADDAAIYTVRTFSEGNRFLEGQSSYFKYLQLFVNSDYGIWPLSDAGGLRLVNSLYINHNLPEFVVTENPNCAWGSF